MPQKGEHKAHACDIACFRQLRAGLFATMAAMLHHRDIVEEIATQRQGEIDAIDRYIAEGRKESPHRWRVRFLDGREPRFQYFVKQEDLRLVECPHAGQ